MVYDYVRRAEAQNDAEVKAVKVKRARMSRRPDIILNVRWHRKSCLMEVTPTSFRLGPRA